jgi:trk system potassium uptake protein
MRDFASVFFILGVLLLMLGGAMLVPAAVEWAHGHDDALDYGVCALLPAFLGGALALSTRGRPIGLGVREAYLLTTLAWIVLPLLGATPFLLIDIDLSVIDAYFETVSGFTTTGSTVLVGLDGLRPGLLMWRSMLQWLGGIGIVAMAVAILPYLKVGGMQIMRQESSDRSEKLLARPRETAVWIAAIYVGLTLVCVLVFHAAGMSLFDAVNHAMTTLSTGGYSTSDQSFAKFGDAAQWCAVVFMILGALPFMLFVRLARRSKGFVPSSQILPMLGLLAAATVVLALPVWRSGQMDLADAIRHAAFNVTSVVTTTGYASTDYQLWGPFTFGVMLLLTFAGGCSGSTAGGVKILRWQMLFGEIRPMLRTLPTPHRVTARLYQQREIDDRALIGVAMFFFLFLALTGLFTLLLTLTGLDLLTALTSAATALANVGPGLGDVVGPAGNFSSLTDPAKVMLCLAMLLGRLELLTLLVVLEPDFWRY